MLKKCPFFSFHPNKSFEFSPALILSISILRDKIVLGYWQFYQSVAFEFIFSLVSLGKPPSNAFPGDPFVPRRIIPVDLFPHTRHYELAILFDRIQLIRPTTTHKDTSQDVESVEEKSQNEATT